MKLSQSEAAFFRTMKKSLSQKSPLSYLTTFVVQKSFGRFLPFETTSFS